MRRWAFSITGFACASQKSRFQNDADAGAVFDLNHGTLLAAMLALAAGLIVDVAGGWKRSCCLRCVPTGSRRVWPQANYRPSLPRIKSGSTSVPLKGSIHGGADSGSARTQTTTSCSSDFNGEWRHAEGFDRGRSGSDREEAIRPGVDHHRIDSKSGCGWSALSARDRASCRVPAPR